MDVIGIGFLVVFVGAQPREGECNFSLGILLLQQRRMHSGGKHILPEVCQSQKHTETNAAHSTHKCPFLCTDAIGEAPLCASNMHFAVTLQVIGFLEYGDKICAAVPEHGIFVRIHGIDF